MKQIESEMLNQVQHDNDKNDREEIYFEEIGEGFASKYERRIEAEKRAEENALSKALNRIGKDE